MLALLTNAVLLAGSGSVEEVLNLHFDVAVKDFDDLVDHIRIRQRRELALSGGCGLQIIWLFTVPLLLGAIRQAVPEAPERNINATQASGFAINAHDFRRGRG